MKDDCRTEEQLIRELAELRQRIAEQEAAVVEHERVKKALQESEETARAFLNSPTDVVALIDTRGIVLDANEAMASRFGKSVDELVGLYCWDLLPPDMAETRRAYADQVIQSGKPVRFEDERQGTWYDNVYYPVLNEQGEVTKVAIWARDITKRKRAEEELDRFFNLSFDMLCISGFDGYAKRVNQAFERTLGYTAEEILAKPFLDFVHAEDRAATVAELERLAADVPTVYFEQRCRCKDGSYKWLAWTNVAVVEEGLMYAAARDITERKRAEEELDRRVQERTAELAASEAHYRALFESSRDGLFIINMRGRHIDVNPAACRLLGYSREELLALDVFQVGVKGRGISSDEQRAQLLEYFQGIWRQGTVRRETELISKSGEIISVEASIAPLTYRGQEAALSAVRDVTARKQMEEALRESEEKSRAQYKGIPVPTYTWQRVGEDLVLVDYNDAATVITQGKIADLMGTRASELYRDAPEIREELRRCVVEKTSFAREMPCQLKATGRNKHFAVKYAFVPPDLVLVHTEDITERKQTEEELRRSQEKTLRSHRLLLALSQATQAMQRARTRGEVYQAIGDEIVKLGYHAIVFTLTDDREHLTILHTSLEPTLLQAAEELAGLLAQDVRIPLTPDSSFWPVITEGKCTFRERIAGHTAKSISRQGRSLIERLTAMLEVEKAIYAPLKISGETRSVLVVASTDLTEADVPAITTFANQTAIALENARLLEQLNVSQKRLRQLAQQITSAQEKERQRLSHALHDEASQALTALKISLQLIQDDLPAEPASLRQRLDDAVSLTDATMEGIRSLAQDLRPPALDAVGLNPTLEGLCRDFARRTQLSIDYLGAELPTLPEAFTICFYRFLQEALTNVAKHACASQVAVVLRCSTARTITLSVEDDGQGFDRQATLSDPSWSTGIGLLGMQERFESLGGWMEIETQTGQGTRLVGHVPLQKTHDDEEEERQ